MLACTRCGTQLCFTHQWLHARDVTRQTSLLAELSKRNAVKAHRSAANANAGRNRPHPGKRDAGGTAGEKREEDPPGQEEPGKGPRPITASGR